MVQFEIFVFLYRLVVYEPNIRYFAMRATKIGITVKLQPNRCHITAAAYLTENYLRMNYILEKITLFQDFTQQIP